MTAFIIYSANQRVLTKQMHIKTEYVLAWYNTFT